MILLKPADTRTLAATASVSLLLAAPYGEEAPSLPAPCAGEVSVGVDFYSWGDDFGRGNASRYVCPGKILWALVCVCACPSASGDTGVCTPACTLVKDMWGNEEQKEKREVEPERGDRREGRGMEPDGTG